MDAYIGQIMLFAGNFAPKNWAFCDGSLVSIQQNSALFSILGTTYGGDGRTTFALPDLRGRVPIHVGAGTPGPGLSPHTLGERSGTETVTVFTSQMATHNHAVTVAASNEGNSQPRPVGNIFGTGSNYEVPAGASGNLGGVSCGNTGGSQPHNNMEPYTAMNYIICLYGIFPSRN